MIFSARDKDMAVDVSQDKTNKNRLILWNQHGEINQRFFIKMFNGKYAIFSAANGGTVEIPNGATQDGVNVQVNQPNKTPNEFWDISPIQGENHAYHIRSFCGKSLDLFEGSTSSNTPIIQWQFHGKKNQIWHIVPHSVAESFGGKKKYKSLFDSTKEYVITSELNHHMALDISQNPSNMGQMILWKRHGEKNQRFRIKEYNNGTYLITSLTGHTVEVPKSSKQNGVQIYVRQANNTPNQQWQIIPVEGQKHVFYIKSFCGKGLDVF